MNLSPILLDGVTVQITKQLESRIDSRQMAEMLDVQHDNFMQTLEKQESSLKELGVFLFQTGKPKKGSKGGRPEKYLLLNENQEAKEQANAFMQQFGGALLPTKV